MSNSSNAPMPLVTTLGYVNLVPHLVSYLICLIGLWKSASSAYSPISNASNPILFVLQVSWSTLVSIAYSKSMPKILAIVGCSFYHLSFIFRFLAFEAIQNGMGRTDLPEMQSFWGYFWILQRNLAELIALGSLSVFFLQFYYDIYRAMARAESKAQQAANGGSDRRKSLVIGTARRKFNIRIARFLILAILFLCAFLEVIMCALTPSIFPVVLYLQVIKIVAESGTLLISLTMLAILISSLLSYTRVMTDSRNDSHLKPKRAMQKLINIYAILVIVLTIALLDPIMHRVGSPFPYYPTLMSWNYLVIPSSFIYGFIGMFAITPLLFESNGVRFTTSNSNHVGSTAQRNIPKQVVISVAIAESE